MEPLTENPNQLLSRKERKALRRQHKFESAVVAERQAKTSRVFTWLIGIVVGLVVLYGFYLLVFPSGSTPSPQAPPPAEVTASDWVKGDQNASATLLEYGDFQCPACREWQPAVNQLLTDFPSGLRIAFRHFPLTQHQNAIPAGLAAEAAGKQGKFWEMADQLYENQSQWADEANSSAKFEGYAQKLGLNVETFKKDAADSALKNKINDQLAGGLAARVNSTPSFFLNGKLISNASPESLKSGIKAAIDAAKPAPPVQQTTPAK